MEAKKATYAMLVESKNEEEKQMKKDFHTMETTKVKLAVTAALERLYIELGDKGGDKKFKQACEGKRRLKTWIRSSASKMRKARC